MNDQRRSLAYLMENCCLEIPQRAIQHSLTSRADLDPGQRIYLSYSWRTAVDDLCSTVRKITDAGLHAVVGISVRDLSGAASADRLLGRLVHAGAQDIVLFNGMSLHDVGFLGEVERLLHSSSFRRRNLLSVGLAGGWHTWARPASVDILRVFDSIYVTAAERALDVYLLSKTALSAGSDIEWERRLRAAGNRLGVTVMMPGVISAPALIKHLVHEGPKLNLPALGWSLAISTLHGRPILHPGPALIRLTRYIEADPNCLVDEVWFRTSGCSTDTARWVRSIRNGDFRIEGDAVSGWHLRAIPKATDAVEGW